MTFKVLFLSFLALASQIAFGAKSFDHKNIQLTLLVAESDAAMNEIVEKVEGAGGYFVFQSGDRLRVKFPNANAEAVLEEVQRQGPFVEFNMNRWDMRPNIRQEEASLKAKQEALKDYMKVMRQTTKREDVVPLQAEINRLILEIERLKGNINYMKHQSQYAEMDISFRQRQRNVKLNRQVGSDFKWINEVNVGSLLEDYR
ncbi:MAG: DUF4349 domain-containing protein [Pseudomonadota bacterium]